MSKKETETTYEALMKLAINTNTQRLDKLEKSNKTNFKDHQTIANQAYANIQEVSKRLDRLEQTKDDRDTAKNWFNKAVKKIQENNSRIDRLEKMLLKLAQFSIDHPEDYARFANMLIEEEADD